MHIFYTLYHSVHKIQSGSLLLNLLYLEWKPTNCSLLTYITHLLCCWNFPSLWGFYFFILKTFAAVMQQDELNKQAQGLKQENNSPIPRIWCCKTSCVTLCRLMIASSTSGCFGLVTSTTLYVGIWIFFLCRIMQKLLDDLNQTWAKELNILVGSG